MCDHVQKEYDIGAGPDHSTCVLLTRYPNVRLFGTIASYLRQARAGESSQSISKSINQSFIAQM